MRNLVEKGNRAPRGVLAARLPFVSRLGLTTHWEAGDDRSRSWDPGG
jgi:hypothetical protein